MRKAWRLGVVACWSAALLSGCATDDYATKPIEMSRQVEKIYKSYNMEKNPGHFAVSLDGKSAGYTYCPASRCRGNGVEDALELCHSWSNKVKCVIYAYHGSTIFSADSSPAGKGEPDVPVSQPPCNHSAGIPAGLQEGDRVRHKSFGFGTVLSVMGLDALVLFDGRGKPMPVSSDRLARP